MSPFFNDRRRQRGSVLALVLVLIVLLGFIMVAFLEEAKERILYDALFHHQEDLRAEAYSALETTLAVLNVYQEVDGELWGPLQGWGEPLERADYEPPPNTTVTVNFRDESGRFSLAEADFALLRLVFDEMGFDRADAEELADSLIDWMDEDDLSRLNGFDGEDYADLDPPYRPANAPPRSWDELALIPAFQEHFWDENGVPLPALAQFQSAFSLYHEGAVNLNAAPPLVVRVLDEMGMVDARNLRDYLAGSDREAGTADDRVLRTNDVGGVFTGAEEAGALASTSVGLLEVAVEVRRGEAYFLLRTLVSWRGTQAGRGTTTRSAADERANGQGTAAARTEKEDDPDRRARGSAQTATSSAADLAYPFEILWLAENRKI
ncbi:MAG: general secretion pathway protein GspK [Opitutales bacterium]